MRSLVFKFVVAVAACMLGSLAAGGQAQPAAKLGLPAESLPGFDLALTYNPMLANVTTGQQFWLQGGSVQVHDQLWHGLGIAGNVIGLHAANLNNSGVGLDLIAYTAGLRYTWVAAGHRLNYFGEVLGGGAHGANSLFPTGSQLNTSANGLALQIGGGVNLPLTHHLIMRVVEADWLRTQLPNATTNVENNLRLGAGVLYRFR